MIRAVFFDAGETLLSPRPSWSELCVEVLRSRGHDVSVQRMREAWSHTSEHFLRAAREGRTFSTSPGESRAFWTELYSDLLAFVDVSDGGAPAALYETFSDPSNYGLFEDVLPVLEDLRSRGLVLGVISNFERWLRALLERLGLRDFFDVLAISGELGWEKPDHRIFQWAVRRAGASWAESLHVGDSPNFDTQPALDLGMYGVLLDRHGRFGSLDAPYPVIASLEALPALLDGAVSSGR